jgi:superfamily II DNA or RNA helicase
MKTDVTLRDYQVESIKFLETEHDKLVLAMCPSSGKTETIIHYIDDLYKQNKNVKVLILPHSTNVLLDNFYQRLESRNVSFTYSTDTSNSCNVHVILPQSHSKIKDKYDVVIVDEAHENYFAKTVQNILKRTSPAKQILLTGTPYQFVDKKEFKIHFLALNDLDSSLLPKLRFDIIESDYQWNGNYNTLGEIKSSFIFKKENTDKTLDDTFKFIFDRENFKEVNKTLIVCKSINQSELVKSYLDNIGICSEISNSKNDTKSNIVNDFKENKVKVLIVVNRARLGYDDSDLVNLIDMSGTLNPNIIYQMFARLLRGDSSQQKYYIRLTSKNDEVLNSEISTSLALMLTDKKYIQTFNGKNFKSKNIIIKKDLLANLKNNKRFNNKGEKNSKNKILINTSDIINFYKNVIIELEKNIGLYKFCEVSDVLKELKSYKKHTLKSCKESASKYKTRTEWKKNDSSCYQYAYKNIWLDECCVNMIGNKKYTLESCKEIASKYETRADWIKHNKNSYSKARKENWLYECCINMINNGLPIKIIKKYTLNDCIELAHKYKTRKEWIKLDRKSCESTTINGWMRICMLYAKQDVLKIHTIESCKEIAHKYKTKIEWKKKDILSFLHSFYCDWHKECSIHFEEPKKPKLRKTYIRKSYQNK